MKFCVHAGHVRSKTDGDLHYITARMLADLYHLNPGEWEAAPSPSLPFDHRREGVQCLHVSFDGNYGRPAAQK